MSSSPSHEPLSLSNEPLRPTGSASRPPSQPGARFRRLRRAEQLIRRHALAGAGAGLVPLPGWDVAGILGARVSMLRRLARLYDVDVGGGRDRLVIGGLVAGTLPLPIAVPWAVSLLKTIPGIGTSAGSAVMPVLGGGGTYAIGRVLLRHFEAGGRLNDFDVKSHREAFRREYRRGLRVLDRHRRRLTRRQREDAD